MIEKTLTRIKTMEMYFDILQNAYHNHPDLIKKDNLLNQYLQQLLDYYQNGQWLKDYELDEQGMIPNHIKRGVLSQDALYNFFDDINSIDEYKDINEAQDEPITDEIRENFI